jgi:hypothetical protein
MREVYMLSYIHVSPANTNFQEKHENATKPHIVEQYNTHMGMSMKVTEYQIVMAYVIIHGSG